MVMRLGVFGDIHNNYEALTACYDFLIEKGCDKIACTGDIVGYCASPKECINFMREKEIPSVKGNHDYYTTQNHEKWSIQPYAAIVIKWMQNTLDSEDIKWLEQLPFTMEIEGIQFVHSSMETPDGSCWPYILNTQTAIFHFFMQTTQFCFYGHTHIPLLFTKNRSQIIYELLTSRRLPKIGNAKYLINPGSVGQPRDFNSRSSVVIMDTETNDIEMHRVDYDIATAQQKILDAGLPEELAERLSSGR
jgi:diadenosine tetraphosphatase ApaH/serine/threonine PP2A family protein phosphatase